MAEPQKGYVFNDSKFGSLFIGSDAGAGVKRPRQVELHSASNAHLKLFEDGGFAQYSTNYHRLVLDTLSILQFFLQNSEYNNKQYKFIKEKLASAILGYSIIQ